MELYKEILLNLLIHNEIKTPLLNPLELLEHECYNALLKIKTIIEDDSLEDIECFMKIEKIICLFEDLGSNGGNRHDFG